MSTKDFDVLFMAAIMMVIGFLIFGGVFFILEHVP